MKSSKITCLDVPEEYQNDRNIIDVERKLGIRKLGRRGYDIIKNAFFVEEELTGDTRTKKEVTYFDDFESYVAFVDEEIYDQACYYQCDTSKIKLEVDYDRLFERKFLVEDTIDDYTATATNEEKFLYSEGERIKKQCKNWIDKFNACSTSDEFQMVEQNYRESKLSEELEENFDKWGSWDLYKQYRDFFMWQYIFSALNDKKRFNILMEYMSNYTCAGSLIRQVCTVFNPDDVMAAYNFIDSSKQGIYKQKKRLKDIVAAIKNGLIDKVVFAFFDEVSHYYCEKCTYMLQEEKTRRSEGMGGFSTYRYFETFEDFIKYRKGDLSNCDLTKAIKLDYDFEKCKMDDTTKLPLRDVNNLNYVVRKNFIDDKFEILQAWYNSSTALLKYQ